MGAVQSVFYIQGNHLDKSKHFKLLEMVKGKNSRVIENKTTYGFETTKISLSILRENKRDVDEIINSLDNNGFIRLSSTVGFEQYREYRKDTVSIMGSPIIRV
tara:strand:- start:126 stop:434 length:309 start_codon:yes stop_codon:yes gene_type:complete